MKSDMEMKSGNENYLTGYKKTNMKGNMQVTDTNKKRKMHHIDKNSNYNY